MEKIMIQIICICLCFSLSGCTHVGKAGQVDIVYLDEVPSHKVYDSSEECTENVRIILYHQYGPDMAYEVTTIRGGGANAIVEMFANLEPTGEIVEKISDEDADWDSGYLPNISAESGTIWIEVGDRLYRTAWGGMETVCQVEEALGEGIVVNLSEECKDEFSNIWQYYPRDCWKGVCKDGVLELKHIYASATDVTVEVKELRVQDSGNEIVLELKSEIDKDVQVRWESSNGGDHYATTESKEVSLKAGKVQTVSLEFDKMNYIGSYRYFLNIYVGSTSFDIDMYVEE